MLVDSPVKGRPTLTADVSPSLQLTGQADFWNPTGSVPPPTSAPRQGTDHRGVPVLGLQPPREARRLVSTGIGRVECRHEVGENRIIEGREKPGDIDLSELVRVSARRYD
jgi:hypothetical protein